MRKYENYSFYCEAMTLVDNVYIETSEPERLDSFGFPDDERFGLVSQMRRCAVSIPSNIAEGAGRESSKDFARFLGISIGSCYELKTQIQISCNREFIGQLMNNDLTESIDNIVRQIVAFKKSLRI